MKNDSWRFFLPPGRKGQEGAKGCVFLGRVMDDTLHLAGVVDAWVTLGFLAFFAARVAKALPLG